MKHFLILCIAFAIQLPSFAQKEALNKGKIHFKDGEYFEAINALSDAIDQAHALKPKQIVTAYHIRGKARVKLVGKAKTEGYQEDWLPLISTAYVDAAADYSKALEKAEGSMVDVIKADQFALYTNLTTGGATLLNQAYSKDLTAAQAQQLRAAALAHFAEAEKINPNDYMVFDLKGQAYLADADTVAAYQSFKTCISTFKSNPPSGPDMLVGYVYYRMTVIERYKENDIDKALTTIEEGITAVNEQYALYSTSSKNDRVVSSYAQIKGDLETFQLDLLLNAPAQLKNALQKFEKAIQEDPTNYTKHVAYAQLLEQVDEEKAIEIYKKAIAIDARKSLALFNLGALYVNRGNALYKEANETDDYQKASALQKKAAGEWKIGLPYLEKANIIDPCDRTTLNSILMICINLSAENDEYLSVYKEYKQMNADCGF